MDDLKRAAVEVVGQDPANSERIGDNHEELRRLLRHQFEVFAPRGRQGVLTRRALAWAHLLQLAGDLRSRAERGDRAAIAEAVGSVVGIHPNRVGLIPLVSSDETGAPLAIAVARGSVRMDLDQVLDRADRGPANGTSEQATRVLQILMPTWLTAALAVLEGRFSAARTLGDLVGPIAINGRKPLLRGPGYRLRMTWARFRQSLPQLAIELGVRRLVAALITFNFRIVTKSNFSYVCVDGFDIDEGTNRLYRGLGWGDVKPLENRVPVGSMSTPTRDAVKSYFSELATRVSDRDPGRHVSTVTLAGYHNAFVDWVGNFIAFCSLIRQTEHLRLRATALEQGAWFAVFQDKGIGPTRLPRPVLLGDDCRRQLELYARHSSALLERLRRANDRSGAAAAIERLQRVVDCQSCALLFHICLRTYRPIEVGTKDLTKEIPESLKLSGDFGRHYFLTALYRRGLDDQLLDILARHAEAGVENLSSTSMLSLDAARTILSEAESTVLRQLGVGPLTGLSIR